MPRLKLSELIHELPSWLLAGALALSFFAAILWGTEAMALREEAKRIVAARFDILGKRIGDRTVAQLLLPGTVQVLRYDGQFFICGRANIESVAGPMYK